MWVNNREAGDLRRYRIHYDVTVKDYDDDELDITDEPSSGRHQTPGNESSLHTDCPSSEEVRFTELHQNPGDRSLNCDKGGI